MNSTQSISANSTAGSFKMLRAMVGIGVICALLIVVTYEGTLPRIEQLKRKALQEAIYQVLPGISTTRTFQFDGDHFKEVNEASSSGLTVYAGYDQNNSLLGIAVAASGQGYADIIRVLYGYDPKPQQIIGFNVLESKETPGLGDKIQKDPGFLSNFKTLDVELTEEKKIKNPVATVKHGTKSNDWEIDGITGATISSRAIGSIISTSSREVIPLIFIRQEDFQNTQPGKQ